MHGTNPTVHPAPTGPLTEATAWALLLAWRGRLPAKAHVAGSTATVAAGLQDGHTLLDLYAPLCAPAREPHNEVGQRSTAPDPASGAFVLGHLGQSLDGFIATRDGESRYINDPANIVHLHRLRALCDAVIVGAGTVAADDPRLTTRAVPGPNPVRVILDPRRRLAAGQRVFQDGAAPTLLCCWADHAAAPPPGRAELLPLPASAGGLDLAVLVATLAQRGLRVLFVEGGGVTVSAFLRAGLLDRLHLALAPLLLGDGRRGLSLPAAARLDDALRPSARVYPMGRDVLFDCDLSVRRGSWPDEGGSGDGRRGPGRQGRELGSRPPEPDLSDPG